MMRHLVAGSSLFPESDKEETKHIERGHPCPDSSNHIQQREISRMLLRE